MKKNKKSNIVIVLVVLLLALAVGYAAFSTNLNITGTATTKTGNWDVKFTAASVTQSAVTEKAENKNEAKIINDSKTVEVDAYLQAPGDGVEVHATITNDGILDAKITDFEVSSEPTLADVTITTPDAKADGDIAAGQSREFVFYIVWDANSENTATDRSAEFDITFTYEQDGATFEGQKSFNIVTTNN